MPTKVQLRRMKAKQKRNKRLKEQTQKQSGAPELLQTDSASALTDAMARSSIDNTVDSAAMARSSIDNTVDSAASTSTGVALVEVEVFDNDADATSVVESVSASVDAAQNIEKNANSGTVGTTPKEIPALPILEKNANSASAQAASVEIPVAAPIEAEPPDTADFASLETASGLSHPDKNSSDTKKPPVSNKFLENFNPETSSRERRKLNRQIRNAGTAKRHPGAVYDENGIHIASGMDICDCLFPKCEGCFYECPKCSSTKCGMECRVNRKYVYEQVDFEGLNLTLKFKDITKES